MNTTETVTVPVVGMGATICFLTDRRAGTIVAVSASGKQITVQRDTCTRTDKNGMSECQSYDYAPNPEGTTDTFTFRKNGRWVQKGSDMNGTCCYIGGRREYHDYSF